MGFRNRLNFPPGSITAAMLADGSVTGPKLSFDAIDGKTITGALIRTAAPPALRWEMTSAVANQLLAYSGDVGEVDPGGVIVSGGGAGSLTIRHPTTGAVLSAGEIQLNQIDPGGSSEVILKTSAGGVLEDLVTPANNISWSGGQFFQDLTWTNLPLAGTWVQDGVLTTPQYIKDAAGNVWVRGVVKNGAAGLVATLPAGYRPSQGIELPALRATAGAGTFSTVTVATGGAITVNTNLASAQVRLVLTFCFSATA